MRPDLRGTEYLQVALLLLDVYNVAVSLSVCHKSEFNRKR